MKKMDREIISSVSNRQIKNILHLQKQAKARSEQHCFVCEGRRMFEDARDNSDTHIIRVFVSESFAGDITGRGERLEEYLGDCEYEIVKDSLFREISQTVTPQGILAVIEAVLYDVPDILNVRPARLLMLEDIQDPGNLGTLIRTAEAAGITGVIMSRGTADVYNPKVIRSTMGSIFRMRLAYTDNICESIEMLRAREVKVYAAYLREGIDYMQADFSGECAIMIGNEGNGLSEEAASAADGRVFIRMQGSVESLNAAVAGAVLMFEMKRQLGQ